MMAKHITGAKPRLLVCTDIFGATPDLLTMFRPWRGQLQVLSPYDKPYQFPDEQRAYQHFQQQGGLEHYRHKLQLLLLEQRLSAQTPLLAVGFSAGAAALWCESAMLSAGLIAQAYCFYGGQIRHYAELQPQCPTSLLWALETHFDQRQLAARLAGMPHVSSKHCHYAHGFMNPASANYRKQGAAYYQRWLMAQLQQRVALL